MNPSLASTLQHTPGVPATPAWLWAASIDDGQLAWLAQRLASGRGAAHAADDPALVVPWRVALAWHLRQRDTARALAIADEIDSAPAAPAPALVGRLQLLRAEVCWLQADLTGATRQAERAQATCTAAGDGIGLSDLQVLRAMVAFDRGQGAHAVGHLQQAEQLAVQAGDTTRATAAQAMQAYWSASGEVDASEQRWGPFMQALGTSPRADLAMWALDYQAQLLQRRGLYAAAIGKYDTVRHLALATGNIRRAIFACLNAATHHVTINDFPGALDWVERGLALARPTGWPSNLGGCLALLGRVLTQLGRLESARDALDEALRVVQPLGGSRTAVIPLFYASELAQTMGDHRRATIGQQQVIADAEAAGMPDLAQMGRISLARSLMDLGRPAEALAAAEEALALARRDRSAGAEVGALLALADLHQALPGPAPAEGLPPVDQQRSMQHLLRAVEVAGTIQGFVVAPGIWDRLAHAHAHAGDPAQAYAMAQRASAARIQVQRQESSDRAIAMAVRMEVDRSRAEGEQARALALQAAERAALLESTHTVLAQLGQMGQEITAELDIQRVCDCIQRHLRQLVDARHLAVWLVDPGPPCLRLALGLDGNTTVQQQDLPLGDDTSVLVQCAKGDAEMLHHGGLGGDGPAARPPGVHPLQTALLGPLRVRDTCLGVLVIQSTRRHAYGERERLIFNTLRAYSAIALDNAMAAGRLEHARQALQQSADAERQARQAAQGAVQQRSQFLASVARRLDQPLAQLHGSLQGLAALPDGPCGAAGQPLLAQALRESDGVAGLARRLLELARLESAAAVPALEPFSMAELAHDVLQKCAGLASARQVAVLPQLAPGQLEVVADIAMIERVLTTLLTQALQACPAGQGLAIRIWPDQASVAVALVVAAPAWGAAGLPAGRPATEAAPATPATPATAPTAATAAIPTDAPDLDIALASQMLRLHDRSLDTAWQPDGTRVASFSLPRAAP